MNTTKEKGKSCKQTESKRGTKLTKEDAKELMARLYDEMNEEREGGAFLDELSQVGSKLGKGKAKPKVKTPKPKRKLSKWNMLVSQIAKDNPDANFKDVIAHAKKIYYEQPALETLQEEDEDED